MAWYVNILFAQSSRLGYVRSYWVGNYWDEIRRFYSHIVALRQLSYQLSPNVADSWAQI